MLQKSSMLLKMQYLISPQYKYMLKCSVGVLELFQGSFGACGIFTVECLALWLCFWAPFKVEPLIG